MNYLELTVEVEKAQGLRGPVFDHSYINVAVFVRQLTSIFCFYSRLPQFKEEAKSFVGANMKKVNSN
jgi:hypothetical protein